MYYILFVYDIRGPVGGRIGNRRSGTAKGDAVAIAEAYRKE